MTRVGGLWWLWLSSLLLPPPLWGFCISPGAWVPVTVMWRWGKIYHDRLHSIHTCGLKYQENWLQVLWIVPAQQPLHWYRGAGVGMFSVPLGRAQRCVRNRVMGPPSISSSSSMVPVGNSSETPLILWVRRGWWGVRLPCSWLGYRTGPHRMTWSAPSSQTTF